MIQFLDLRDNEMNQKRLSNTLSVSITLTTTCNVFQVSHETLEAVHAIVSGNKRSIETVDNARKKEAIDAKDLTGNKGNRMSFIGQTVMKEKSLHAILEKQLLHIAKARGVHE